MELKRLFSYTISVLILLVVTISVNADGPVGFVRNLLQNNLVGAPVVHKHSEWDFDPEVSMKRRKQFYELHGFRASKLIERIGLGIDGNADQRLYNQRQRDAGRLGGTIYHTDPNDYNSNYKI